MIGACAPSGSPSLARDVLAGADCLISTQIEAAYAALLTPGGTLSAALTIGLTIYVAIIGYRLILGQAGLTLGELVPHFVKIGLVLALVTSWPAYQALVFDLLFHGPEQLADPILRQIGGAGTASGGVLTALQDQFDRLTDFAGDAWGQKAVNAAATATTATPPVAAPFPGAGAAAAVAPPAAATSALPQLGAPQFASIILWASALLMLASTVGLLLVVRIVLALLLVFGPVFVAFALFANTRGLFEGWLRMAVKFALVPLIALPLVAAFVAVIAPFTAALTDEAITDVRAGPVLVIGLIVLVLAAVMLQVTRLTAGIAGGIRLPRGRAAVPATASAAAGEMRVVTPVAAPSRAELLVQTLRGSGGQPRATVVPATAGETPGATRRIATAADAPPVADSGGRLGQGYRRLAIGQTSVPRAGR